MGSCGAVDMCWIYRQCVEALRGVVECGEVLFQSLRIGITIVQ